MTAAEPGPLAQIDVDDPTPPFEQVRAQIAARVARGDLPAGTRLPTVRGLAADLGLAVNTVARVYRELEADGVVETRGRQGTVVRPSAASGSDEAGVAAAAYVASARRLGLTRAEAHDLLDRRWEA